MLDSQLQDTIYQFEHKRGVVRKIDESSRQLAEALESAVPIVITTLQKFPFVSRHLLRMAEERGTETEPEAGAGVGSGTGAGTGTVAEVRTGAEAGTEGVSRIGGEAEISAEAESESGPGAGLGAGAGRLGAAAGAGALPARRYAVIIDEAHSSQGGETAAALKEVLGGEALRARASRQAATEGHLEGGEDLEALFLSMAKRGRQANLSFFAFTATPKHKTLKVFGRGGEPAHRYAMRQAIEEGFILDVLNHYTTYSTYYRLLKACADDPNVERKKAARALARFVRLHPHNVAQKTEVMVEHFNAVTRHRIGGRAKAMVVTGSRLEAVRYKQSFDRYIGEKGYPIKSLVAFSGVVEDDRAPGVTYTEEQMNEGVREKELPERFAAQEYQVLLVAEKYQTGFDQPLLHTMYVDKRLAGIQAVQTLSRLNRTPPLQGGHLRSRLRERPRRNPRSVQDVLRRGGDGRRGRSGPDVCDQGRPGRFRHLPGRGGRALLRDILQAPAASERARPPGDERRAGPGGGALHRIAPRPGAGRRSRAVAWQGAGVPQSLRLPEPGHPLSGLRPRAALHLPAPLGGEAPAAAIGSRVPVR